jgi:hypothetical protein
VSEENAGCISEGSHPLPQNSKTITGRDIRVEVHNGLADWLDFETTRRRVICRRGASRGFTIDERSALDVARELQDAGLISIMTRHDGRRVTYLAERVP